MGRVLTSGMAGGSLALLRVAVARTATLTHGRPLTGRTHEDADQDAGTIATDSARNFDPFPLLLALHAAGARVVVIGQVAGILHGSCELTGDLDLLWDGDPTQAEAMVDAFGAAGCRLFDDEHEPVWLTPQAFGRPKVVFESPTVSGDCCTPALPWGELRVAEFLGRALTADEDGLLVRYLCRADLIAMREAVGRPKDLRRAAELRRL
jgi:hypothetical protein